MIKLGSVNKFFNKNKQNEIHVLNNIDLELPERGMVAVFGKSGCGKTTLLNVIGGLDGFSSGSVEIENTDIRKDTDGIRNKYIGYIFQNYNLNVGRSCFDNVADALRLCGMTDESEIEKRVVAALSNVGMAQYKKRTPDTLSGGQQQRVAIARAIVKNPRIILADEPTGNLDELNTVAVMDLLKELSKEHLVVLVTHEAELVDYYCDKVIELSDGKVEAVRDNDGACGYASRNKNDIYLGELQKSESADDKVSVEYYGDAPAAPVSLKIVNNGGKLYVRIDTPNVQMLDGSSEIKLREGVFARDGKKPTHDDVSMTELPPVQGKKFGRLFSLGSALKSGYKTNFVGGKRGKKFLRRLLVMFSAVFVLAAAFFGTAFKTLTDIGQSYSHQAFYVRDTDGRASDILLDAQRNGKGNIDNLSVYGSKPDFRRWFDFAIGYWDTFGRSYQSYDIGLYAVLSDVTVCKGKTVVGRKDDLKADEAVISTEAADLLLESSAVGYIKKYEHLLGMGTYSVKIDGKNVRIVGVAKSDESAIYLSELSAAKCALNDVGTRVSRAAEYDMDVNDGEMRILVQSENDIYGINVGDEIAVHGIDFTVSDISISDGISASQFLVSDSDFVALSKRIGETNSAVNPNAYSTLNSIPNGGVYIMVHSSAPKRTAKYLRTAFDELRSNGRGPSITTPDDIRRELMSERKSGIIQNIVALAVIVAMMSLCMYFIMRSSLMVRIKEIGIYRAIGVSKKNMLFKFFVETFLLTTLTVFIGYLFMSIVMASLGTSALMTMFLYYPLWLALAVLVVLYLVCIVCGMLPILMLLRKTPSEILAKYDI